jgi:hypothetical protein
MIFQNKKGTALQQCLSNDFNNYQTNMVTGFSKNFFNV